LGVGEIGVVSSDFHRLTGATANESRKNNQSNQVFYSFIRRSRFQKHPGFLFQTYSNSISDAISKGIEQFGEIDVVVNNAGIGSLMLTELRQTLPEPDFIARMRSMFGGGPKK
jgi:NAD(P)-dependent dehydrogenase (short-subunit alcohol dehydrogenase family)